MNAQSKSKWSFDFSYGGLCLNVPAPLKITQTGQADIYMPFAKYRSEEYTRPLYWLWRFSKTKNKRSWGFEAIHHKLYLLNKPNSIQQFSISHGYNILHINRGFHFSKINLIVGAGAVLAHPEIIVRNQALSGDNGLLNWGYYLSGPSVAVAVNKKLPILQWLYFWAESKCNISYSTFPIGNGRASVWQMGFHFLASIGVYFSGSDAI